MALGAARRTVARRMVEAYSARHAPLGDRPGQKRLGCGHSDLQKGRWDEPAQWHLIDTGHESPCQDAAADRAF